MKRKAQIMDGVDIDRALARMTHEIIERNGGVDDICLLGIKSRGVPLSARLARNIEKFEGVRIPCGYLDITLHRDDLSSEEKGKIAEATESDCHFPCDVRDRTVVIVDDVLYTGRTARAAMEAVFAFSRPKAIRLAVLIDRGHRELPIRPDYVGKNVPTGKNEKISVVLSESDGNNENGVYICDIE